MLMPADTTSTSVNTMQHSLLAIAQRPWTQQMHRIRASSCAQRMQGKHEAVLGSWLHRKRARRRAGRQGGGQSGSEAGGGPHSLPPLPHSVTPAESRAQKVPPRPPLLLPLASSRPPGLLPPSLNTEGCAAAA